MKYGPPSEKSQIVKKKDAAKRVASATLFAASFFFTIWGGVAPRI
jgi:hypothetical protein